MRTISMHVTKSYYYKMSNIRYLLTVNVISKDIVTVVGVYFSIMH